MLLFRPKDGSEFPRHSGSLGASYTAWRSSLSVPSKFPELPGSLKSAKSPIIKTSNRPPRGAACCEIRREPFAHAGVDHTEGVDTLESATQNELAGLMAVANVINNRLGEIR